MISALNSVQIDVVLDYIPVVSTVTNIVKLALRALHKIFDRNAEERSHFFTHIHNQSVLRSIVLLVPGIGNLLVGVHDFVNYRKALTIYEDSQEYEDSIGNPGNPGKAHELIKQAADLGLPAAQNKLGSLYWHGVVAAPNTDAAVKNFRIAAAYGHSTALYNLHWAYSHGTATTAINHVRAITLLEESSERGCSVATDTLAQLLAVGTAGLEPNRERSSKLVHLANEQLIREVKGRRGRASPQLNARTVAWVDPSTFVDPHTPRRHRHHSPRHHSVRHHDHPHHPSSRVVYQ